MDALAPVVVDYGTFDLTPRAEIAPAPTLQQIKWFQEVVGAAPQVEVPVEHFFAPGQYVRTCTIPADTFVVGKMHRHEHFVMLVKGEASILTDKGMERITGPKKWISKPGAKRPVHTHTDCEFLTVHSTDETDLDVLEAELIVPEAQIDYEAPQEAAFLTNAVQGAYA